MRRYLPLGLATVLLGAPALCEDWPQWGGPTRDFKVGATGLARSWPEGGPRRLWSRELGDGYSAVVAGAGRLYTLYRPVKGALASLVSRIAGSKDDLEAAGGLLYAAGSTGKLHALDAQTGAPVWARDLWGELGGRVMERGYSCSPIAWNDTVS
jgi:hypothetical protein